MRKAIKLIGSILVCEAAGLIGSVFTISSVPAWYATLNRPALSPPNWLFGPVWVTLYALMGISLWLILQSHSKNKTKAVALFAVQLILNAVWTPVFFGAHFLGGGLALIILLWAAIILIITVFKNISKRAAWLLVPYIIWVSFAAYLNFAIWRLN